MEKILSISIAAYNAENDITRCLESMLETKVSKYLDIIIVNDGSTDNTSKISQKYVDLYPDIVTLVDKKNGGHGSTINESIKIAKGKYYKIVDSDDWVDTSGLEKLVYYLMENECDIIFNPYYEIDANTLERKKTVYPYCESEQLNQIKSIDSIKDIIIYMHSITFNTKVIKKMGPIITENCFYVDMEYTIFPLIYISNYVCLEFPVYEYLLGTQTQSMNMNNLIKRRDQHLLVTKRIIDFWSDNKLSVSKTISELVLYRIKYAIVNQYIIYMHMLSEEGKQEALAFDQWLKHYGGEVYAGTDEKLMKWIYINRYTNFRFFNLGNGLLKKAGRKPFKK